INISGVPLLNYGAGCSRWCDGLPGRAALNRTDHGRSGAALLVFFHARWRAKRSWAGRSRDGPCSRQPAF
ncbi:MAG: hypothetical protein M3325_15495, partial [Actinomycetota bacterium]|nr:hypothetical protein [Actinomycetota bacterium]